MQQWLLSMWVKDTTPVLYGSYGNPNALCEQYQCRLGGTRTGGELVHWEILFLWTLSEI